MNEDLIPIICRNAFDIPPIESGVVMYMPGGLQKITPIAGGIDTPIVIRVDSGAIAALESQRQALTAQGKRPYFDFNHDDQEASFWPEQFFWSETPKPGIYAKGEWTTEGHSKVTGKSYRQFSPVFHVDNKRGNPARIVCRENAKPNMGGFVNNPAFHNILPLWAKAGDAASEPATNDTMNEQELAALRAKNQELEQEISALKAKEATAKAKGEADALVSAEIRAKEAEHRANAAQLENEALKAKAKTQGDTITARNKADAEAAVKRAVDRGAIAAKDSTTQSVLVAKATEDPSFLAAIEAMQGSQLSGRITPAGVQVTREAPNTVLKAFAGVVKQNAELPMNAINARDKGKLAREASVIFAKEIENDATYQDMTMEEAIQAADVSSDQLGLLSGTLVLQRTLPLLQYQYPILSSITQDFSDSPGLLNQVEMTRIVLKPAVLEYDASTDTTGRPKGWGTVSAAQTVDVPVKLDKHVGVPIVFGVQMLASTIRNLFGETSSQALNALGGHLAQRLAGLMTAANFNAYAATSVGGGATTSGDNEITVTATTNMYPGQEITGAGIPAGTYVKSIESGTKALLTQAATATATGLTFTLNGGKVPTTYGTYVKALNDFGNVALGQIAAALDAMEVPEADRFALLNAAYFGKLASDPLSNSYFAAVRHPEILTDRRLPKLQGFDPIKAAWLAATNNRTGFAGHKSALVLKTRLPMDFTSAVGAMVPGSVTTVTAPGGFSVLLVQYVNLQGNYAEWRPEVLTGVAVGERRAGMIITSA